MITIEDFNKIDMRCGQIIEVLEFPEARKPAYRIRIDFGSEIGVKKSCAQLTSNYKADELLGKLIRAGFKPLEVPVSYSSRSFQEGKKIRVFSDPFRWIWAIVKFRFSALEA